NIQQRYGCNELSEDIVFQLRFYAHGGVNMIAEWLFSKNPDSPEIFGQKISNSMPPILKTLFP
ncbi:MAG TPA: TetR-like C-terminal domain-containing protein, partial [Anaerovoracaceae bacterium]|nr:TetR-like C-terminal domain-containing protein [Anaerovoracaceae bacterium]